jgi:hypothetical protein
MRIARVKVRAFGADGVEIETKSAWHTFAREQRYDLKFRTVWETAVRPA